MSFCSASRPSNACPPRSVAAVTRFHYVKRNAAGDMEVVGPLGLSAMGEAVRDGDVTEWTLFATDQAEAWSTLAEHADLYAQLSQPPAEKALKHRPGRKGRAPAAASAAATAAADTPSADEAELLSSSTASILVRRAMSQST
eukprot:Rhum_TRINITY_DN15866_c0_g1::Rhum_TRINITY_DN15866_c0_g1_i1::g.162160::m.162160